ncbi:hypothetical protein WOSG25_041330 [Weissella oryzae SG25]|uniref:Uncharacterized protein n=1 Tax=Weissella oryzae (strain DSM 25784 / JCM 18191 / LMG 30913 / SG25) TaxID=1329250 RepID=A0A069CTG1_WEIOS|nr:hypothetical protein [Weissella oryzae]GAK30692.1 hypothetical protein WOSG25_041330 [Weissella oryzae SG25]
MIWNYFKIFMFIICITFIVVIYCLTKISNIKEDKLASYDIDWDEINNITDYQHTDDADTILLRLHIYKNRDSKNYANAVLKFIQDNSEFQYGKLPYSITKHEFNSNPEDSFLGFQIVRPTLDVYAKRNMNQTTSNQFTNHYTNNYNGNGQITNIDNSVNFNNSQQLIISKLQQASNDFTNDPNLSVDDRHIIVALLQKIENNTEKLPKNEQDTLLSKVNKYIGSISSAATLIQILTSIF